MLPLSLLSNIRLTDDRSHRVSPAPGILLICKTNFMNTATANQEKIRVGKLTAQTPSLTIVLSIQDGNIQNKINDLKTNLDSDLNEQYGANARPFLKKLSALLDGLNHDNNKKTAIIHLSPTEHEVIYLDTATEEKIFLDHPFELRTLLDELTTSAGYILVVQSANTFKMFRGDGDRLEKIKVTIPDHITDYKNDIPEKTEYFTDTTERKEIMLDKFILHIDKELGQALHTHNVPVFIVGPERMNGHFKKLSHHNEAILEYIHGNYDDAKPQQLLSLIRPYLSELNQRENANMATKIEKALNANKLRFGVEEVLANVLQNNGNSLIVEKNYSCPVKAYEDITGSTFLTNSQESKHITDAVDLIIKKVLEAGGTVKFVDEGALKGYKHIALILHY